MKISKLKIKNIKCFEEIEIPFENDNNDIKNWSLIVGDNGSGKTTILRSLALGLCDSKRSFSTFIRNYMVMVSYGQDDKRRQN